MTHAEAALSPLEEEPACDPPDPSPLPSARRTQDRRTPLRLGSHRLTRLRLTPLQWIGGGATAFVALIGLLTGGIWSAVIMTGLILLVTALYGVALRRPTWLGLPRRRGASGIAVAAAVAALVLGSAAYGATAPAPVAQTEVAASTRTPEAPAALAAQPTAARTATPTPTPTPTVVVTTETVTETVVIPRAARTEDDPNADRGTSTFAAGVDGVLTRTFEVVKHDGAEVSRSQISEAVTTAAIDDVTRVGTRVPPLHRHRSPTPRRGVTRVTPALVCRSTRMSTAPAERATGLPTFRVRSLSSVPMSTTSIATTTTSPATPDPRLREMPTRYAVVGVPRTDVACR
ncbi:G5 domain-containing protein [Rathayibacter oskolensis]|uniref:G5 domain-containing protein n=1 Tax=Rathayibacter oskolensis TaxID=1891671 RepID=UPI00265EC71D|nr:G5 domain-containing protein [Rathayibacter oskolensis]WKK71987.1 G5 domain-containing protein [Rathayibacter oskolensis]